MGKVNTRKLALGGMLSAMVWLLTTLIKVPVPATGGYVHLGDGMIFLSALLLGPYAGFVGAIGSALADLLGGYFIYVLPTFLIKGLMGLVAGFFIRKERTFSNALVFVGAELLMVTGYFLFEGFLYGWATAFVAVGPNMIQGFFGVAIGVLLLPITRLPFFQQKG